MQFYVSYVLPYIGLHQLEQIVVPCIHFLFILLLSCGIVKETVTSFKHGQWTFVCDVLNYGMMILEPLKSNFLFVYDLCIGTIVVIIINWVLPEVAYIPSCE